MTTSIFPIGSLFWSNVPTSQGWFHKLRPDMPTLTFYQPIVHFPRHPNYLLWTSSHERHVHVYAPSVLFNAFIGHTSQAIHYTLLMTRSKPSSCQKWRLCQLTRRAITWEYQQRVHSLTSLFNILQLVSPRLWSVRIATPFDDVTFPYLKLASIHTFL